MAVLTLRSEHWAFDSANVTVLARSSAPLTMSIVGSGRLQDGSLENVSVPSNSEIVLQCEQCWIRSIAAGTRWFVSGFHVSRVIASNERNRDIIEIRLDQHILVRIRVVDRGGKPIRRPVMVGLAFPDVTVEQQTDESGNLNLLLAPGVYDAYLVDNPKSLTSIDVSEAAVPEKTVTLTDL